jgi:nucleotide-binding universal stress UspA family protein
MDDGATTTAPATAGGPGETGFRHVACCVDGAPGDADALRIARGIAGADRRMSVVHVAGARPAVAGDPSAVATEPEERGRDLLERAAAAAPGAEPVLLEGAPGPAICRWAEAAGADLLVVASRHPGRWGMSVLGQVTRHVVDHAPCAVLVVRYGEA